MFRTRKLFILLSLLIFPMFMSAQIGYNEDMSYWDLTLSGGTSVFLGDVSYRPFSFSKVDWRLAAGGSFGRRFSALLGGRGTITFGKFAGEQKNKARKMDGSYFEVNANALFYFVNLFAQHRIDRFVQPYLIGGFGVIGYSTTMHSTVPGENPELDRQNVEGAFLFGLGIDFQITSQWSVGIESTQHVAYSDLLDSWSGHPWKRRKERNDFPHDTYNITVLNIKYRFGGYFNKTHTGNYLRNVTHRKLKRAF